MTDLLPPARLREIEAVYATMDGAFPIDEMARAIRDLLAERREREWRPIERTPVTPAERSASVWGYRRQVGVCMYGSYLTAKDSKCTHYIPIPKPEPPDAD